MHEEHEYWDAGSGDEKLVIHGARPHRPGRHQRCIPTASPLAPTYRFQYGYDRDGNRQYRNNLVNTLFGELYHASGQGLGYDNFNQMTAFERGTLFQSQPPNGPFDSITATHSQGWGLDNLGNWKTFSNDQTGPPTHNSGYNVQNQISSIDSGLVTPTYDGNGNTTKDERGNLYSYDAWNRLAQTTSSSGLTTYSYDALNRRIIENPGTARDLYYSKDWQVLEEQVGGAMQTQNVWSPIYVDALVLRDNNTGQRLYVQQDANWNVTAIIGNVGAPQERYVYDPYGKPTVLNPLTWAVTGTGTYGTSSFAWVYLHQGGRYTRFDDLSGLYYFRNRDLSPTLGRWMEEDPIG